MDSVRLQKLQSAIRNPILIKKKENLFYLTGRVFDCRAEEYLLVTKRKLVGFGSGLERIDWVKKSDRLKNIGKYLSPGRLDIEHSFTFGEAKYLELKVKNLKLKIRPAASAVDQMRQIKDSDELSKIRKSMEIVGRVFEQVKKGLRNQAWTEKGLAEFIVKTGFKLDAEEVAFPPIVAAGSNAAIPHHVPSSKRLKPGESVIIDFGFKYKHYCSDFTRTVFLKKAPKRLEAAYNQVEKAYNESMDFINSSFLADQKRGWEGVKAGDVYQRAVEVLSQKKLDKYFIHSLGHGTGLEIHELPSLSPDSKDILRGNMVFSLEPAVYLPNSGGVRIEDLVYLKNNKAEKFINVSVKLRDNIF